MENDKQVILSKKAVNPQKGIYSITVQAQGDTPYEDMLTMLLRGFETFCICKLELSDTDIMKMVYEDLGDIRGTMKGSIDEDD